MLTDDEPHLKGSPSYINPSLSPQIGSSWYKLGAQRELTTVETRVLGSSACLALAPGLGWAPSEP